MTGEKSEWYLDVLSLRDNREVPSDPMLTATEGQRKEEKGSFYIYYFIACLIFFIIQSAYLPMSHIFLCHRVWIYHHLACSVPMAIWEDSDVLP